MISLLYNVIFRFFEELRLFWVENTGNVQPYVGDEIPRISIIG